MFSPPRGAGAEILSGSPAEIAQCPGEGLGDWPSRQVRRERDRVEIEVDTPTNDSLAFHPVQKVVRGRFSDTLTITADNIRPRLAFDMFTVQRSNKLADGTADPAFATNVARVNEVRW
jgi:hypothetical protein